MFCEFMRLTSHLLNEYADDDDDDAEIVA